MLKKVEKWPPYFASNCFLVLINSGLLKMPVNSVSENRKGVVKPKFSLSLSKKNATFLSNVNRGPCGNSKENTEHSRPCASNKENRPAKRASNGIYSNTVSAAKRLKPLTEAAKLSGEIV